MKISVTVHPSSKKPRIIKNDLGNLEVYVAQKAVNNQANSATIERHWQNTFKLKNRQLI